MGTVHSWLHRCCIFIYNHKQSYKPACFEWPRVHVEESCSTSINNMVFFDAIDQTEISVFTSIGVRIQIGRYNQAKSLNMGMLPGRVFYFLNCSNVCLLSTSSKFGHVIAGTSCMSEDFKGAAKY